MIKIVPPIRTILANPKPVKDRSPRRNRGQGQAGRFSKREIRGLPSGDSFIDQMKLAVGTRPANRAGVVDRVAEPKQLRRRTGRFYGTSRIPAKNSRLFFNVRFWGSNFSINGVDRNGLYPN